MQTEAIEKSLQSHLPNLIGCDLINICFRMFCADFVFLGNMEIIVRVKKQFKFTLNGGKELTFDPTVTSHDDVLESTKFLYLQGMRCRDVVLTSAKFEVTFEGSARLWLDMNDKDFEPLELIGSSGDNMKKLAFYYVL